MQVIKNEKGITLTVLVITIVVLLIMAGISINWGLDSVKDSKDKKLEAELNMVQHAVFEEYTKYEVQSKVIKQNLPGTIIKDFDEVKKETEGFSLSLSSYDDLDEDSFYYKLEKDEDGKISDLGLENVEDTYIVNYKTGEVMNITTKTTNNGTLLYLSK